MFICVAWYASLSIVVRELLQRTAFAMTKNVTDLLWVRFVMLISLSRCFTCGVPCTVAHTEVKVYT